MTRIRSRKPTGRVPWPTLLLEGEEKAGKSYRLAEFSTSKRIGDSWWLDLGEGAADEYGALPGARYEVLEHDGSYASILEQIIAVREYAAEVQARGEPPVALFIDSMSALWDSLKDWATERAKESKANRKLLAEDPNAEIVVTANLWNDANARWHRLMTKLLTFPGIVVVTARGKEIAAWDEKHDRPVKGERVWRVEGHKSLGYAATAWIRMKREEGASLIGARSLYCGLVPGKDKPRPLPENWTLEWFVFEALRCDPATAHVRDLRELDASVDLPDGVEYQTPEEFRERVAAAWDDVDQLRSLHAEAEFRGLTDKVVTHVETEQQVTIGDMIVARGRVLAQQVEQRRRQPRPAQPRRAVERPQEPQEPPAPADHPPGVENAPETGGEGASGANETPPVIAELYERLGKCQTAREYQAVYRWAGRQGIRRTVVRDEELGEVEVGRLIMHRQKQAAEAAVVGQESTMLAAAG
ncbi:hypothetical protein LI90_4356 (plasmid) [Carbonactinospora thermoautotrophica]|uniref:Uncharacterized protein n=1 Tax=Carbonactinospora thermoautotrophica TaxID=1469144 RepID=A0A132MHS1_9ACTN|nr:AAA family ATPase [Carbonactinospora thermoautotrophica]KWW97384.1 hypothetical protein LI90_4356 [Carbonactinospora thermoautotrophica]